jgi:hypothetical protein
MASLIDSARVLQKDYLIIDFIKLTSNEAISSPGVNAVISSLLGTTPARWTSGEGHGEMLVVY